MSLLDINTDGIELSIIKYALRVYITYYYKQFDDQSDSSDFIGHYYPYVKRVIRNNFNIKCDFDIYEEDLKSLMLSYSSQDPGTIFITKNYCVEDDWRYIRYIYLPPQIYDGLKILTVDRLLNFSKPEHEIEI